MMKNENLDLGLRSAHLKGKEKSPLGPESRARVERGWRQEGPVLGAGADLGVGVVVTGSSVLGKFRGNHDLEQ